MTVHIGEIFVPERLVMARSLRGLTATALAAASDVSPAWLSKVENGHDTPSPELTARIADVLNMPATFMFREPAPLPRSEAFHFRASSKLALKDETAARSLASLASELSEWMDSTYKLPVPGIPDMQEIVGAEIAAGPEVAAESLRQRWALGSAPVSNMVALLESKGARIFSVSGSFQAIDAFSFRHRDAAIIFLNPSKSAERLRFDLAHELGHLVLHGGSLYEPDGKARERQANDFASAFLMPRAGVLGALRGTVSLESVIPMRTSWKVSAMALVVRLHQLSVISDWTYRKYCQELAKRGFRRGEPGSTLQPEASSLWAQILSDLREHGAGISQLADLLDVRATDIRSLLVGLVPTTFDGGAKQSPGPRSPRSSRLRLVDA
jgi:Zn-dependent peptidase ImmA (M78 family)/transcriptional regulator with XRE-family HTH domain